LPRKFKIKETRAREYLKDEFKEEITMIFDKKVEDGRSRRRPDALIVECENKRMMEIFWNCGSRPIVFIRFNPDAFEEDGKRQKGCLRQRKLDLRW
jgi:hypothetical protein